MVVTRLARLSTTVVNDSRLPAGLSSDRHALYLRLLARLLLTVALEVVAMTASNVALFALTQSLIPDEYCGRVIGFSRSLAVLTIPISALTRGRLLSCAA